MCSSQQSLSQTETNSPGPRLVGNLPTSVRNAAGNSEDAETEGGGVGEDTGDADSGTEAEEEEQDEAVAMVHSVARRAC